MESTKVERGEKPEVILAHIKEHVPSWAPIESIDQLDIKKMSGLSNACYRVHIKDGGIEPATLLYRKFECEIVDKKVEGTIFQSMSD